jgi:F-type H+-transporting ATPase subunit b
VDVLGLTPHVVIPTIILLLILMVALNYLLYRPMLKVMDDRKGVVDGAARDAAKAEENMNTLSADYDNALQEARKDAKAAFNKAHEEALLQEKEILTEAQSKVEKVLDRQMGELEKNVDAARNELKSAVTALSHEVSSKILGRSLS